MANAPIYPATLTAADVISAATVTLLNDVYTLVGEYTVKADELVGMGRGGYASQDQAIGRLYMELYDNSQTPVHLTSGKFRIMMVSSQDIPAGNKPVYIDVDLAALGTGSTIPSDRYVFPFDGTFLSKDKKWQFYVKNTSGSSVTLSQANSTILMDVSRILQ